MKINRFEDLECWQEARKLLNKVYDSIRDNKYFQNDYRLRDQCTGAVISVMANITEGFARRSRETFGNIYDKAGKTARMTSALITYLRNNEKRYKPKKPDKP